MSILKPESLIFTFNLFFFSSKMEKYKVDIPKAVLVFLPIVFSQAKRSAEALRILEAGSFSFDPQLPRRFPFENWDELFLSSFQACKLAIAAEGDIPSITEPSITETTTEHDTAEIGTENWGKKLLSSSYEACKSATASETDKPTIPEIDVKIRTPSRGSAIHTISRRFKGLFKSSKS